MEGFGVAVSCALQKTPLTIVRGISNRVGENRNQWKVGDGLEAARELLLRTLQEP